jgi:hypothetical protein
MQDSLHRNNGELREVETHWETAFPSTWNPPRRNALQMDGNATTRRNIKGAPFGVGFECSAQPLQKGTPFYD